MECTRCEKYLEDKEMVHDYMGNEWCNECMDEEVNRKLDEHFKPFEDFEKTKNELTNAICMVFKIDKIADWIESKLRKV